MEKKFEMSSDLSLGRFKFMRNIITAAYPKLLEGMAFLSPILVLIIAFFAANAGVYGGFSFSRFLTITITGFIGIILSFGLIFAILDIRDELKKQGENQ